MDTSRSDLNVGARFFEKADWWSFVITAALSFLIYFFTLAPDVTLEYSGVYSVAATYGGVGPPPGYPLWSIYGWFFTKLLPFGNIAWRLAVSSAVAACSCGLIALMVARCGGWMMRSLMATGRVSAKEEQGIRLVCGYVAGMIFGFSRGVWHTAIVVDVWSLSLLLFCLTLCSLMRWLANPTQIVFFHAGVFLYGLTLTNSQLLAAAALGLQILIAVGKPALGRDVFLGTAVFLALLVAARFSAVSELDAHWLLFFALLLVAVGISLAIATKAVFTEWRILLGGAAIFLGALSLNLVSVVVSMSNPPVNWAYPRTVEGFWHLLRRGQFESLHPVADGYLFLQQVRMGEEIISHSFGLFYIFLAVVPPLCLRSMPATARRWLATLFAVGLSMFLILIVVINPAFDRPTRELIAPYFTAIFPMLSIWSGCGLVAIARYVVRNRSIPSAPMIGTTSS